MSTEQLQQFICIEYMITINFNLLTVVLETNTNHIANVSLSLSIIKIYYIEIS
jgi:hypothetical protein